MKNIDFTSKERCEKVLKYLRISRALDEKMNKLVKQNKGTTFFLSNQGHELIGVLTAMMLDPKKDYSFPYYRDRAFVLALGAPLQDIIGSFLARNAKHHSGGRMMPDHFVDSELNITPQSSCVGSQYLQAVGLSKVIDGIVYVSGGEGSTSQGDFHEALNFSSIYSLPTLFVIQDNNFAISVSKKEQTAGESISKIAKGFENLLVLDCDGTDYVDTSEKLSVAISYLRERKGPVLLVAKVVRLKAHSNSDDPKKYKSDALIEEEQKKDPIALFEKFLKEKNILTEKEIEDIKTEAFDSVEKESIEAEKLPFPSKDTVDDKLFKPFEVQEKIEYLEDEEITLMDALNRALKEEMQDDENVIVFGEDVANNKGGVFGVTRGLTNLFGKDRCFNSPLAESTILGMATGMCFDEKTKPVVEIQFADYTFSGINQLVNELASIYYRSNGEYNCQAVIRIPFGGYIQGGPYHSQSIEALLCHTPGLKVVVPSNAADAKMLLKTAIKDPNPVVFLEHKAIYRQRSFVARKEPTKDSYLPFGKANIVCDGDSLTVVCYGMMVMWMREIARKIKDEENISIEVIDLRTLVPLDKETIINSVKKTSKLLILHEDKKFVSLSSEIAAIVMEEAFDFLDAPIKRICALDIPIPYSKVLEDAYFPQKEDVEKEIRKLLAY